MCVCVRELLLLMLLLNANKFSQNCLQVNCFHFVVRSFVQPFVRTLASRFVSQINNKFTFILLFVLFVHQSSLVGRLFFSATVVVVVVFL